MILNLFKLITFIALFIGFISCKKEKSLSEKIVGKWQRVEQTENGNVLELQECRYSSIMAFLPNKQVLDHDACIMVTDTLKWNIDGNKLTITADIWEEISTIQNITDSELIVTIDDEGVIISVKFKRMPDDFIIDWQEN